MTEPVTLYRYRPSCALPVQSLSTCFFGPLHRLFAHGDGQNKEKVAINKIVIFMLDLMIYKTVWILG